MEQPRLVSHCLRLELSNSTEHHGLAVEGSDLQKPASVEFLREAVATGNTKGYHVPFFSVFKIAACCLV